MTSKLSIVFSAVVTACALVITTLVVRREFFVAAPTSASAASVEVEDWEALVDGGRRVGANGAVTEVVEFIDFQCPFCAHAAERLGALLERFPDRLAIIYRHFPIDEIHPHATDAAVAAECAADQGRFQAFHDALFASQARIGIEGWSWFADRASIEDVDTFESCIAEQRPLKRVSRDVAMGESIGVRATPSFVIDGKLYAGTHGVGALEALLSLRPDDP